MKVTRDVLIDGMPGLYAVGQVAAGGRTFCAAASENRGGTVYLADVETGDLHEITGGPGGVMAVLPEEDGTVLMIEEFYPVFDSATAKIAAVDVAEDETGFHTAERGIAAEVPYVHRIGLLREKDGRFLAAGRLCQHKDNPDDWSTAGTLEIAPFSGKAAGAFEVVQDGTYKHHAMFIAENEDGYDDLFYGGTAGTFRTVRRDGAWVTERMIDVPTSDIVFTDLDGDGEEELAIIEEFHGANVAVFKMRGGSWERQVDIPINFGHVLWGGTFLGEPGLIVGSRGGKKDLTLYRFGADAAGRISIREEILIDEGQAPAQITVSESGDSAVIYAANHGAGQLVRYRCSV